MNSLALGTEGEASMRSKTTPEQKATARALREQCWRYKDIAAELDLNVALVYRLCDERLDGEGGECACGCGGRTRIATADSKTARRGQPYRFIAGHNRKVYDGDYVVNENGCWIWQRATDSLWGYGQLKRGGTWAAHRWYYERTHGPVPDGLELDHLCRTPVCVNPDHLEPVTHDINMQRSVRAKITREQVDELRASTETTRELAARYGLSRGQVRAIVRGDSWRT